MICQGLQLSPIISTYMRIAMAGDAMKNIIDLEIQSP
jgi:hypothetical protein